jgi:4'-phosphopantetheinyl transferase
LAVPVIALWLSTSLDARSLARHALGGEPEFRLEPGGKPFLPNGPHLSLAHTRAASAVVVSTLGPVGVDLEDEDRELPAAALARHWFSKPEADWVALHPNDFLPLWTLKEAVGKALGTGLRGGGLRRPMPLPPPDSFSRLTHQAEGIALAAGRRDSIVVAVACIDPSALDSPIELRFA